MMLISVTMCGINSIHLTDMTTLKSIMENIESLDPT